MNNDDLDAILREHGAQRGVILDPVSRYSGPTRPVSDKEAILRDHGATGGVILDPVSRYSGPTRHVSDEEAILRDHGATGGVILDPVSRYSGPTVHISDEEAIRRDHGVGIGVPVDKVAYWGTNQEDLINFINNMIHASSMKDLSAIIPQLSNESLIKIIEQRYRKTANKLDDRNGLYSDVVASLGESIYFDFQIISEIIAQNRDLFGNNIDVSNYVGYDNKTNIFGLLDAYKEKLLAARVVIPMIDARTGQPIMNPYTNRPYNAVELLEELQVRTQDLEDNLGFNQTR